eukprot:CAMPEP_0172569946 /NCGR_PEP_ID=MMETSP1067-20121228/125597_1 /TAXON_ID=265564 ORGANISM="Thalassiosira punctigera, Strain Tpunct2005C2" /NCGR_SAMPLE_ID=MMETSP1067 /ASSEMBLY_ACC=CAM_ASM_000444 /LENGTH=58 /DNA_ID=CAMNT_0013361903 /DNA_START=1 /DNA_END=173 /DNA_ORIENTATION=+
MELRGWVRRMLPSFSRANDTKGRRRMVEGTCDGKVDAPAKLGRACDATLCDTSGSASV